MLRLIRDEKVGSDFTRSWRPDLVTDMTMSEDFTFTKDSCWTFIENLLADGHELRKVKLRKFDRGYAFEMLVDQNSKNPRIYIKMQIGAKLLYGISFHNENAQ